MNEVLALLAMGGLLLLARAMQLPRLLHEGHPTLRRLPLLRDLWSFRQRWARFRAWEAAQTQSSLVPAVAPTPEMALHQLLTGVDAALLPRAGTALATPPNLATTMRTLRALRPEGRALVPFGWYRYQDQADLAYSDFWSETYFLGLVGPTRHGKSRAAFQMLRSLAEQLSPEQLQLCLFDLKRLDFVEFKDKAHSWMVVEYPEQIEAAVAAINAEINRRAEILSAARVTTWEDYQGDDLPLIVLYIAELATFRLVLGDTKLNLWLNDLFGRGAGYGFRGIVDSQNLTTYGKHWRDQLSDIVVGPLTNAQDDYYNTGLKTETVIKCGAVPPSALPREKGLFTVVSNGQALTVRTCAMTNEERLAWIDTLPSKTELPVMAAPHLPLPGQQALTTMSQPESVATDEAEVLAELLLPGAEVTAAPAEVEVPAFDRRRILEAATRLSSRRDVCQEVYGSTGGENYKFIKAVLAPYDKLPIPVQALVA